MANFDESGRVLPARRNSTSKRQRARGWPTACVDAACALHGALFRLKMESGLDLLDS